MKTIELPDEFLAQITRDDLLENYEMIADDFLKCFANSPDYCFQFADTASEELDELLKLMESFKIVLKYYGIEV
jgi:hypothetical protein